MIEDIVSGIVDVLKQGIYGLLQFVLWLISTIVQFILLPIDSLIRILFPNFTTYLNNFSNSLSLLISAPFNYFWYILPPITRYVLALWLTTLIAYYSVIWTYRGIIFIPKVIRKIKFW